MTDKEILRMKLNLKDLVLDEKDKEDFLEKVEQLQMYSILEMR